MRPRRVDSDGAEESVAFLVRLSRATQPPLIGRAQLLCRVRTLKRSALEIRLLSLTTPISFLHVSSQPPLLPR